MIKRGKNDKSSLCSFVVLLILTGINNSRIYSMKNNKDNGICLVGSLARPYDHVFHLHLPSFSVKISLYIQWARYGCQVTVTPSIRPLPSSWLLFEESNTIGAMHRSALGCYFGMKVASRPFPATHREHGSKKETSFTLARFHKAEPRTEIGAKVQTTRGEKNHKNFVKHQQSISTRNRKEVKWLSQPIRPPAQQRSQTKKPHSTTPLTGL